MARKVFISFLGTNNYLQTRYVFNGEKSPAVRFVQQALIGFLCKDWTVEDRVLIFYTKDSYDRNWVDGGQGLHVSNVERIGLHSALQSMDIPMQIEDYEIAEGFTEEDIWSIFDCVYDKLEDGDLIYFDVTHAFRSIPLFSIVLFNYARFTKNTQLVSIHYGAFEKLGPAFKVKDTIPNPDDREAPIVDLTSLAELQNTNVAASNFIEFGKVGTIADQLVVNDSPVTNAQRKSSEAIKCLKAELAKLDSYIETCRMDDIRKGKYIRNINDRFKTAVRSNHLNSSEKLLLIKIKENLRTFKGEDTEDNIIAAIQWAFRYGMVQQAYTLGQEFIITKACNLVDILLKNMQLEHGFDFGNNKLAKRRFRDFVSGVMAIVSGKEFSGSKEECELADELLTLEWMMDLKHEYNVLRQNRNSLNHAKGGTKTSDDLMRDFGSTYDRCIVIISDEISKNV